METVIVCATFLLAIGIRLWALSVYSNIYNALPDATQKTKVRRAMLSGN